MHFNQNQKNMYHNRFPWQKKISPKFKRGQRIGICHKEKYDIRGVLFIYIFMCIFILNNSSYTNRWSLETLVRPWCWPTAPCPCTRPSCSGTGWTLCSSSRDWPRCGQTFCYFILVILMGFGIIGFSTCRR